MRMSKTFSRITPESAEIGDFSETGFVFQDRAFDSLLEMAAEIRDAGSDEPSSSVFHSGIWYSTVDAETIRMIQEKCEGANEPLKRLIIANEGDLVEFIDDAISSDGRGHFMNSYDNRENEADGFYIYRMN